MASSKRAATAWRISCARPAFTARPLCDLHGEPFAVRRVLCGRRARRALLHLCQFVSDRARTRLYRQQQPVESAHHVAGEARHRARGAGAIAPRSSSVSSSTGPAKGRACAISARRRPTVLQPQSPTRRWAQRCSIPPARPADRRACCVRCLTGRRRSVVVDRRAGSKFWRFREGQIYLSPAPLYHSAPQAGVSGTIRRGGTVIVMERFDAEHSCARRAISRHPHPARADDVLAHAETAGSGSPALRSLVARGRRPRRGAVSRPGQAGDDRLVGADHPRVLRAPPKAWA